ncbi:hypothetical protein BATDEDRAFT_23547 [Batrachochytrium dendrobatidis JAM81]|uniref:Replication factor A protein 3 n=1 Tax=Batrachochytrium dendrobatidis (strain JAM81 / FGSC 10211) TaxID=684364 RepID=F4NXM5_BATDJ|nr:uncharacterized protein BATDEDRAFT_23547 [Batrachochytrium dendrobatidis JAM81]EGF82169.1 hypothetical protein BATDEDRAFT_23547 [Batrachochytrium dendrobatidis JAM81]|eukprot:XP_006677314.1 hypothetical protein BATDEDRAFT_23547 [Batrachochytrium dendrobatidis JAM81]
MSKGSETPRINSSMLHKNVGRTVRLVGRISLLNAQQAILEASDKGQVNILLVQGSTVRQGVVEILGRVEADMSVTEISSCMFDENYGKFTDSSCCLAWMVKDIFLSRLNSAIMLK